MDATTLFGRLQLRPDAGERDVRRAYASRLKKLDQETQAGEFQDLRETYEQLLWWLQHRHQSGPGPSEAIQHSTAELINERDGPDAAAPPAVQVGAAAEAGAPGGQVLDDLLQEIRTQAWTSRAEAEAALHSCLDDQRLTHVDARHVFEWGVAHTLASGWRPNHQFLLVPAIELFGWERDRGHVLQLGEVGRVVDAAVVERALFNTQDNANRNMQMEVIRKLRSQERPARNDLVQDLSAAEWLRATFPHWLHVITQTQTISQWQQWADEIPPWQRRLLGEPEPQAIARPVRVTSKKLVAAMLVALMGGFAMFNVLLNTKQASEAQSVQAPDPQRERRLAHPFPGSSRPNNVSAVQSKAPDPGARAALASLQAKMLSGQTPSRVTCRLAADLVRENAAVHKLGDMGREFDGLILDCRLTNHDMPDSAVEPAYRRETNRAGGR